jgi:hypothetical protein
MPCLLILLLLAFQTSLESIALDSPDLRQADIVFCREHTKFVPLNIEGLRVPVDFPVNYQLAIDQMWLILKESVKVREVSPKVPILFIAFDYTNDKDINAHVKTVRRDRCGKPDRAVIYWSKHFLNRTVAEFSRTFLHEIMHLMGGFGFQHATYYFLFGKKNLEYDGLICGYILEVGSKFYAVSPGVVEEVKKFDPKLIGAPMECIRKNEMVYPGYNRVHEQAHL